MLKKFILLPIVEGLVLLAVTLDPNSADACSCAEQTVEEAVKRSDAIFEGRVVEIRKGADSDSISTRSNTIRFRVVRSWKGVEKEEVAVRTASNDAGCGYPFRANQSYLVYANSSAAGLRVGLCSRTKPIDDAEKDLNTLGMGQVPVSPQLTQAEKRVLKSPRPSPARTGCASCNVIASEDTGKGALAFWLATLIICLVYRRSERRGVV